MSPLREYKYHISIIAAYLLVCVYFFFFTSSPFSYYNFNSTDLLLVFPIAILAFIGFYVANRFVQFGTIAIQKQSLAQLLKISIYAGILISLPEEIIFRGFMQTYVQSVIPNINAAVVV